MTTGGSLERSVGLLDWNGTPPSSRQIRGYPFSNSASVLTSIDWMVLRKAGRASPQGRNSSGRSFLFSPAGSAALALVHSSPVHTDRQNSGLRTSTTFSA
ncbi:MAG: hypothetical protein V3T83_06195 [Acidobacteriota bacterium]